MISITSAGRCAIRLINGAGHQIVQGFFSTVPRVASQSVDRECWNCLKKVSCKTFFCDCGKIQKFCPGWSLFDLFGIPKATMDVDIQQITNRKRSLQRALHPDKFIASTKKEQEIAATVSAQINDAFTVLANPLTRAEYILTLNGSPCSSEDVPVADMKFLVEVMEMNEKIDMVIDCLGKGAEVEELSNLVEGIHAHLTSRWDQEMAVLGGRLRSMAWDGAHEALTRARYFDRLRRRLRELKPQLSAKGVNLSF